MQRKCLKCQLFLMKTEGRESISAAVYVKNLRRAAMSIRSAQTKDLSRIAEIFDSITESIICQYSKMNHIPSENCR